MENLLIVESPAKRKTIQNYLGQGWQVLASFGHFRDLPIKSIGVEPPSFRPHYEVTERGSKTLTQLRKAAKSADEIYLATDLDREGEAIAWHIQDALKLKNPKRVTFSEITKTAVNAAIASPRSLDMNLVKAQEARRVLDRLVGYMVSPALSDKANQQGLSAGRVQSPAVRIIVDREREIRNFQSIEHYSALLNFDTDGIQWSAELDVKKLLSEGQNYLTDKSLVEPLLSLKQVSVNSIEQKESKRSAPPPFKTSTLQRAASIALGLSTKETMELAQSLFDDGLITYHRTDSLNLSDDAIAAIKRFAGDNGYQEHIPDAPNTWKSGENSQEAHEAIRPTDFDKAELDSGDSKKDALYQLIRMRAIASQFKPAIYDTTKVELVGHVNDEPYTFIASGSVEKYKGWKVLVESDQSSESSEEQDEKSQLLPNFSDGEQHQVKETKLLTRNTKPPSRYSESALVEKMEAEGIGRPSTYASIIQNITSRNYVVMDNKKRLVPTDTGELIVDALVDDFNFLDLGFTKEIEKQLDQVASGQYEYQPLIAKIYDNLSDEVSHFRAGQAIGEQHLCPDCSKPLALRPGKYGKFWACTGYPDCQNTFPDDNGKPGERKPKPAIDKNAVDCPECEDGKLVKRKGKKNSFLGCSNFPKCKHTQELNDKKK